MKNLTNKKGDLIPFIGLGTFPFQGAVMKDMVIKAVKAGYRLFDTSDDYRGEDGIGLAIKQLVEDNVCSREDLFIQTKVSDNNAYEDEPLKGIYFNPDSKFMKRHSVREVVREKVDISLRELRTDYLDSLLIHYPFPYYYIDIWKEFIALKKEGKVRYIGVSNFHKKHIETLYDATAQYPDINEVYLSPIATKDNLVSFCKDKGILIHTYSPLMDVSNNRINGDALKCLTNKYGKSLAQIVLRWNIERGCLPLPKTKNEQRLKENFSVFDFSLTPEDVELVSSLNEDYQYLVETKICPGI